MSMIRCERCDAFIDTDADCEGVYESKKPWAYFCFRCVERAFDRGESAATDRALAAYKGERPGEYNELFGLPETEPTKD